MTSGALSKLVEPGDHNYALMQGKIACYTNRH